MKDAPSLARQWVWFLCARVTIFGVSFAARNWVIDSIRFDPTYADAGVTHSAVRLLSLVRWLSCRLRCAVYGC
jgi:hypothetical protein